MLLIGVVNFILEWQTCLQHIFDSCKQVYKSNRNKTLTILYNCKDMYPTLLPNQLLRDFVEYKK